MQELLIRAANAISDKRTNVYEAGVKVKKNTKYTNGSQNRKIGYTKLIYQNYDVVDIVFYATKQEIIWEVRSGNTNTAGIEDEISQQLLYIKSEDIADDFDWDKFQEDTITLLAALFTYANSVRYCWEWYNDKALEYEANHVFQNFVKSHPHLTSWGDSFEFKGDYYINEFVKFLPKYDAEGFEDYIEFLKSFAAVMEGKATKKDKLTLRQYIDGDSIMDDILTEKALKRAVSAILLNTENNYEPTIRKIYKNTSLNDKPYKQQVEDFVERFDSLLSDWLDELNEHIEMLHKFDFGPHTDCGEVLEKSEADLADFNFYPDVHPLLHKKKCAKISEEMICGSANRYFTFDCESTYMDVSGNVFNVHSVSAEKINESDDNEEENKEINDNLIYIYREKTSKDITNCDYLENLLEDIEPLILDCDAI